MKRYREQQDELTQLLPEIWKSIFSLCLQLYYNEQWESIKYHMKNHPRPTVIFDYGEAASLAMSDVMITQNFRWIKSVKSLLWFKDRIVVIRTGETVSYTGKFLSIHDECNILVRYYDDTDGDEYDRFLKNAHIGAAKLHIAFVIRQSRPRLHQKVA